MADKIINDISCSEKSNFICKLTFINPQINGDKQSEWEKNKSI